MVRLLAWLRREFQPEIAAAESASDTGIGDAITRKARALREEYIDLCVLVTPPVKKIRQDRSREAADEFIALCSHPLLKKLQSRK